MTFILPDGTEVQEGSQVHYQGKIWTVRGKKLIHPIPEGLLNDKVVDKYVKNLSIRRKEQ